MRTDFIKIRNFKSINDLVLKDCRKINLLIGPPNVGKSNILEALSLFDIPFAGSKFLYKDILKTRMRLERPQQLFPYGNYQNPIKVETSEQSLTLSLDKTRIINEYDIEIRKGNLKIFDLSFPTHDIPIPEIMVYYYPSRFNFISSTLNFLKPPYGTNLMQIIKEYPKLSEELTDILNSYGLTNVYDSSSEEFKAFKNNNGMSVYMIPFESLASSIKHLIFYKAAIISNQERIICFEEPESNTFPPYISSLINSIITDKTNQYFISSHSPYVINQLLETDGDNIAIYKIGFSDGFTECYRLTDNEIQLALDYGMDLLFNIETFPVKS